MEGAVGGYQEKRSFTVEALHNKKDGTTFQLRSQ